MLFKNRFDAGELLSQHLKLDHDKEIIMLLVPRGGVEVGLPSIKHFQFEWDLIITRKIGAPHHKEIAIGAVTVDGQYLLYEEYIEHLHVPTGYIEQEIEKELREIKRRLITYRGHDSFPNVQHKVVILVDDGIATGFTLLAAIKSIKAHQPKKLILAVPVGPTETIEALRQFVDEIICLHSIDHFTSVGAYYETFPQVTEEQMSYYLEDLKKVHHHVKSLIPLDKAFYLIC